MFTTTELARELGVHPSTIQKWTTDGYVTPEIHGKPGVSHVFGEEALAEGRAILDCGGVYHWRQAQSGLLTSTDVVGGTPLTYRRLDNWVRMGLLTPVVEAAGSGTQRLFHPAVVDEITDLLERIDVCPFDHGDH